jgi:hypothetical protein
MKILHGGSLGAKMSALAARLENRANSVLAATPEQSSDLQLAATMLRMYNPSVSTSVTSGVNFIENHRFEFRYFMAMAAPPGDRWFSTNFRPSLTRVDLCEVYHSQFSLSGVY